MKYLTTTDLQVLIVLAQRAPLKGNEAANTAIALRNAQLELRDLANPAVSEDTDGDDPDAAE